MTFDEAHGLIKKGDILSLRHELDAGASPDLSNRFSWTLLMMAAIEGVSVASGLPQDKIASILGLLANAASE